MWYSPRYSRSSASVRACCQTVSGTQDHFWAMNDRFSPGARFSAIIAASMQMVPEPQNGSQKKSRPRYRARFTMAAAIVSCSGARLASRR